MTNCLKGHRCGGRRRGLEPFGKRRKEFGEAKGRKAERAGASESNESLISPHLRYQIYAATPLIASIVYRTFPALLPLWQIRAVHAIIKPKSNRFKPKKVTPPAACVALRRAKPGSTHLAASKLQAKTGQTIIAVHCHLLPAIASHCQPYAKQNWRRHLALYEIFCVHLRQYTVKTIKPNQTESRGFSWKKFRIFFRALLWEIIGKTCKNRQKNRSNLRKKHAIFDAKNDAPKPQLSSLNHGLSTITH